MSPKFEAFFKKPIWDFKIAKNVNKKYKVKQAIEIVQKIEEFKLKMLSGEKQKNESAERYSNFIEALNWVISAD